MNWNSPKPAIYYVLWIFITINGLYSGLLLEFDSVSAIIIDVLVGGTLIFLLVASIMELYKIYKVKKS